jgi:hypothetical protein
MMFSAERQVSYRRAVVILLALGAPLLIGCPDSTTGPDNGSNGITVVAGTWSYSLTEHIPLPSGAQPSCIQTATGTTTVGSDGSYSITFPALSCSSCTMSASVSGTVASKSLNGSVHASINGGGCSVQQPTPNPASATGACSSTSCEAVTADGDSFSVDFTMTPPA